MRSSEKIDLLAKSLCEVQKKVKSAKKDSENPYFESKYADLTSVWEACRFPLVDNGFSVTQTMGYTPSGAPTLITTLLHVSGQYITGELPMLLSKADMQGLGSAITYARRYGLASIVGICPEDDDAEGAVGRTGVRPDAKNAEGRSPDGYYIDFGKFKNKTLEQVGVEELKNYVNYIEDKAAKHNKPLVGKVKEFVDRACDYVASWENDVPSWDNQK